MAYRLTSATGAQNEDRHHPVRAYRTINWAEIDPTDSFRSIDFDDFYFSFKNPIGERRDLLCNGLNLKEMFEKLNNHQCFCIGETGFGTGLTFALALQIFLNHAPSSARLQWITVEAMPMSLEALGRAHKRLNLTGELLQIINQLQAEWPDRIGVCHRRFFKNGRVILDLHLGDATEILSDLNGSIDAWCLDGFSPNKNPEIWKLQLFREIARLSVKGTKIATFTSARAVTDGLGAVGFITRKVEGFQGKRNRLNATFLGENLRDSLTPNFKSKLGHIVIVGGGLSGAWLAHSFAKRGISVSVVERYLPASEASGNRQGITYSKLSIEATPSSIVQLQGLLTLPILLKDVPTWHQTGVLILAQSDEQTNRQKKLIAANDWPATFMKQVTTSEASDLAGIALNHGGIWLPTGGWLDLKKTTETLLNDERITVQKYSNLQAVKTENSTHQLMIERSNGIDTIEADTVIFTNALESARFAPMDLPLIPLLGQVTELSCDIGLKVPICGETYLVPSDGMRMTCGATYRKQFLNCVSDDADDLLNIQKTNYLLSKQAFEFADISGNRTSIRTTTPDYTPIAGQLADPVIWSVALSKLKKDATYKPPSPLPFIPGLFALTGQGSRGSLTAPVTAEIVASQILGEVLPVSNSVRDALSPDRFFRRNLIRSS